MQQPFIPTGPRGLGDLLDGAFRLYRAHFAKLALTAAVFFVPLGILTMLTFGIAIGGYVDFVMAIANQTVAEPDAGAIFGPMLGFAGAALLLSLGAAVCTILVQLGLTSQIVAILNGETLSVGEGIRRGLSRFWPFVGMVLLAGLALMGVIFVTYILVFVALFVMTLVVGILATVAGGNDFLAVGMIGLVLVLYFVMIILVFVPVGLLMSRWIAAPIVVVSERQGAVSALSRSWQLTRRHFWRCFGYLVLLAILNFVILGLPILVLQWTALILLSPQMMGWLSGITDRSQLSAEYRLVSVRHPGPGADLLRSACAQRRLRSGAARAPVGREPAPQLATGSLKDGKVGACSLSLLGRRPAGPRTARNRCKNAAHHARPIPSLAWPKPVQPLPSQSEPRRNGGDCAPFVGHHRVCATAQRRDG